MSLPYAEVIGDPVDHSKSPLIHGFWLEALGLAGRYGRTAVSADDLPAFFAARRRDPDWRGCNVTVPHKERVIARLDRLDPLAARIGAVNTVVREADGALVGHNSDAPGFLRPLAPLLARPHLFRMARVLGTGGAARAIVAALADQGFTLVVAGRDPGKARALLDELAPGEGHHAITLAQFAEPTDFPFDDRAGCLDLVVNATSLGMAGQPPLPFDISHAPPGSLVYDIVYAPLETPLLAAARARGLPVIDGLEMLVGQAAIAFGRFFGQAPPPGGDRALRERLLA
ncbi:shikimate dehydrogenase [Sphingomonas morindae]|uniref:Shikimate dehydrogenase (NADP(+)) n=1 Tax=Sphingomonas morindae TaxID=1541170 RepID=A0ABY4XBP3_9SPHN|nr:shikimate dehydrogenase [Sphingomonas morindae]USI74239.1 shikimate dehydrogenase [Sphingomonas morindae]